MLRLLCLCHVIWQKPQVFLFRLTKKYHGASHRVAARQVRILIKPIEQKDRRCRAEWILGSGNANRCAFVSFSILWTLPQNAVRFIFFLKKSNPISCSFAELLCTASIISAHVFTWVKPAFWTAGLLVCFPAADGPPEVHSVRCYIWLAAEVKSAHLVHLTHNLRFAASEEEDRRTLTCCECTHWHLHVFCVGAACLLSI